VVKRYRVRRDGGPGRVAMPPERHTGTSYMQAGVVAIMVSLLLTAVAAAICVKVIERRDYA